MDSDTLEQRDARSRGFDRGNYAASYETLDLEAYDAGDPDAIYASPEASGYVLGFFSSYELAEMPGDWIEIVTFLRARIPGLA